MNPSAQKVENTQEGCAQWGRERETENGGQAGFSGSQAETEKLFQKEDTFCLPPPSLAERAKDHMLL